MSAMDTEMVNQIYLVFFSSDGWLNGCHCRPLTEDESKRYEELNRCYEEEGLFPKSEPTIIQTPEELSIFVYIFYLLTGKKLV